MVNEAGPDAPRLSTGRSRARPETLGAADNGDMPHTPTSAVRLIAPAQAAEILGVPVDEIMGLVGEGQLRGMRVGSPARWRIEEASVADYLDGQAEIARRAALWNESQEASFPELWGTGRVRHGD